jgi:hypothetical protein
MKIFCKRASGLLLLITLLQPLFSMAQLGKQLSIGMTMSSFSSDQLKGKSHTGLEIAYHAFAKYSDRLEWTSGFGYMNVGYDDAPAYSMSSTSPSGYEPTTVGWTGHLMNIDYMLSYYPVPDMLAVTGGFILAFGMPFPKYDESRSAPYLITADPATITNPADIDAISVDNLGRKFVGYGPVFGASLTLQERYVFYFRYQMNLNTFFDGSENTAAVTALTGDPKIRVIRLGFSYKFLGSYKDRRF